MYINVFVILTLNTAFILESLDTHWPKTKNVCTSFYKVNKSTETTFLAKWRIRRFSFGHQRAHYTCIVMDLELLWLSSCVYKFICRIETWRCSFCPSYLLDLWYTWPRSCVCVCICLCVPDHVYVCFIRYCLMIQLLTNFRWISDFINWANCNSLLIHE